MDRILVVNVNWLGDCVMTLPAFKALKMNYPSSYVGVMVAPRVKNLFSNNPYIDVVIEFDERTIHRSLISKIIFIRALKRKRFDTAILIHRSFTRAAICALSGIKTRIGFKRPKTSFILTKKIDPPEGIMHRAHYYFSLFEKINILIEDKIPQCFLTEEEKEKALSLLGKYRKKYTSLVAVNPSANWLLKRWPVNNFIELITNLTNAGYGVVLIGTRSSKALANQIARTVRKGVINLYGRTTLRELAGVFSQVDLLISGDSGPAHLAASCGSKVLILFGPTVPSLTAPLGDNSCIIKKGIDCQLPCYNLDCRDNQCMKKITAEEVFRKAQSILLAKE